MSYLYAIALNVFPLIPFGYLGNENTRLSRIPIAYFPIIASFTSSLVISRFRIRKGNFFLLYHVLLSYLFVQSFLIVKIQNYVSFLEYYSMWAVNILLMLTVSFIVNRINYEIVLDIFKKLVLLIAISSLIGILKFLIGLQDDANFMPMMNRNGTAYLIVSVTPILLFLGDTKLIKFHVFIFSIGLYFICLLFIQSRMGLMSFFFTFIIYYIYNKKFQLHKLLLFLIFLIFIVVLYLPPIRYIEERIVDRTLKTVLLITSGEGLTPDMGDYARFQLILYSIEIIKENFWFGTGVGLENYRDRIKLLNPIRESKPHNFYLSYLAEFGAVGFSILLILLFMVWRRFLKIGISKELSYTFSTIFITNMFMLFMNEYITYPLIWWIWGIGLGLSYIKQGNKGNR
jgi:O-antigen ligase